MNVNPVIVQKIMGEDYCVNEKSKIEITLFLIKLMFTNYCYTAVFAELAKSIQKNMSAVNNNFKLNVDILDSTSIANEKEDSNLELINVLSKIYLYFLNLFRNDRQPNYVQALQILYYYTTTVQNGILEEMFSEFENHKIFTSFITQMAVYKYLLDLENDSKQTYGAPVQYTITSMFSMMQKEFDEVKKNGGDKFLELMLSAFSKPKSYFDKKYLYNGLYYEEVDKTHRFSNLTLTVNTLFESILENVVTPFDCNDHLRQYVYYTTHGGRIGDYLIMNTLTKTFESVYGTVKAFMIIRTYTVSNPSHISLRYDADLKSSISEIITLANDYVKEITKTIVPLVHKQPIIGDKNATDHKVYGLSMDNYVSFLRDCDDEFYNRIKELYDLSEEELKQKEFWNTVTDRDEGKFSILINIKRNLTFLMNAFYYTINELKCSSTLITTQLFIKTIFRNCKLSAAGIDLQISKKIIMKTLQTKYSLKEIPSDAVITGDEEKCHERKSKTVNRNCDNTKPLIKDETSFNKEMEHIKSKTHNKIALESMFFRDNDLINRVREETANNKLYVLNKQNETRKKCDYKKNKKRDGNESTLQLLAKEMLNLDIRYLNNETNTDRGKRSLLDSDFSQLSVTDFKLKDTLRKHLLNEDFKPFVDNDLEYDRRSLLTCYLVVLHLSKIVINNSIWQKRDDYDDDDHDTGYRFLYNTTFEKGTVNRLLNDIVYRDSQRKLDICYHGLNNEHEHEHFLKYLLKVASERCVKHLSNESDFRAAILRATISVINCFLKFAGFNVELMIYLLQVLLSIDFPGQWIKNFIVIFGTSGGGKSLFTELLANYAKAS